MRAVVVHLSGIDRELPDVWKAHNLFARKVFAVTESYWRMNDQPLVMEEQQRDSGCSLVRHCQSMPGAL